MDIKQPTSQSDGKPDKEKLILEAALKAFATHGIAQATTRQIAEIAGIGKSTIFEYFKSKEELQDAAFHYLISGMTEGHKKMQGVAERDPLAALALYVDSAIQTALYNPSALLLISQYSLGILLKTNQFETVKDQYGQRMHSIMQDLTDEFRFILEKGIAMKVFHPAANVPMEGLVYTIGALIREIQAQAFLKSNEDLSGICNIIKETIFNLLGVTDTAR